MLSLRLVYKILAFAALLPLLSACSGSDGSSNGPTGPGTSNASLEGTWVGTSTSESATGTCLANNFSPITVPARWVFRQTGSSFTADLTLNGLVTCPFRGSVSGNSVTVFPATSGGAPFCLVLTASCSGSPPRQVRGQLRTDLTILTATVSGNRMTGSGTSVFTIVDVQTGQSLGEYQVRSSQTLAKQ
jgi:hypothetical protein